MDLPNLKKLHVSRDCDVLVFHDGLDVLKDLFLAGVFDRAIAVLTFSWFVSDDRLKNIARVLGDLEAEHGRDNVQRRLMMALNSPDEFERACTMLGEDVCLLMPNSVLLNPDQFYPAGEEKAKYDCVYNARANLFKRHYLTTKIDDKIFVAYDWKFEDVDLNRFFPKEIYKNIRSTHIGSHLRLARVGLMLSEEEGSCYASLEYLLCGLPVVSTPSRGGRDVFYNENNSIICDDTPEAVAEAVREASAKLRSGKFSSRDIHLNALSQLRKYRSDLLAGINKKLQALGAEKISAVEFKEKLASTNKLWKYRNMRIKEMSQLQ